MLRFVMPLVVALAAAIAIHWLFGFLSHAVSAVRIASGV